jgi:hypothetical protein
MAAKIYSSWLTDQFPAAMVRLMINGKWSEQPLAAAPEVRQMKA